MSGRPLLTLDQFLAGAPATLEAFAVAYRREAQTDSSFVPARDEQDWYRELAAYAEYVELDEETRR